MKEDDCGSWSAGHTIRRSWLRRAAEEIAWRKGLKWSHAQFCCSPIALSWRRCDMLRGRDERWLNLMLICPWTWEGRAYGSLMYANPAATSPSESRSGGRHKSRAKKHEINEPADAGRNGKCAYTDILRRACTGGDDNSYVQRKMRKKIRNDAVRLCACWRGDCRLSAFPGGSPDSVIGCPEKILVSISCQNRQRKPYQTDWPPLSTLVFDRWSSNN